MDGLQNGLDQNSVLQRYTRQRRKSLWNKLNLANGGRPVGEGRMTAFGLGRVEAAKADGRWERAHDSGAPRRSP